MALGAVAGCGTGTPVPSPAPPASSSSAERPSVDTTPDAPSTSVPASAPASEPAPEPTRAPPTAAPPVPPPTTPAPTPAAVPARLLGVDWSVLPIDSPVVALTFDCGASDAGVASILHTLAVTGVRGTFFVTGAFARTYPADVAAISAAGHLVGNHSDTHVHYPQLTNVQIAADLATAQASIVAAGAMRSLWFRFPYGDRTDADIRAVNAAGWVPIRWTVDTLGWQGTSAGRTADEVTTRVLDAARPGEIVLMHVGAHPEDGSTLDADALPAVIALLRDAGYGFTTTDLLPE